MAQFETIYLDNGQYESCVNVRKVVGIGGANLREDVLLIQALFNYLGHDVVFGSQPEYTMPEISGTMDGETYSAIGEFQLRWLSHLMMKTFDGRIHPASYKNRKLTLSGKPLMTITLLHVLAGDAALMNGDLDYTLAIAQMNGELAMHLDRSLMEL